MDLFYSFYNPIYKLHLLSSLRGNLIPIFLGNSITVGFDTVVLNVLLA